MGQINQAMQRSVIGLIRGYRYFISSRTAPRCRFHPTCSNYAEEAITSHGWVKGAWLALIRFIRCHPFCRGGADPVPAKGDN